MSSIISKVADTDAGLAPNFKLERSYILTALIDFLFFFLRFSKSYELNIFVFNEEFIFEN
jgi:hypothetical protein